MNSGHLCIIENTSWYIYCMSIHSRVLFLSRHCQRRRMKSTMLYSFLTWSMSPLLFLVIMPIAMFSKFVLKRLPPIRWTLYLIEKCLQLMACVQVSFVLLTVAKMTWSLCCIALCWVSDFVETNHEIANFQAFLDRYYWPSSAV
jgi:hypothetical protein